MQRGTQQSAESRHMRMKCISHVVNRDRSRWEIIMDVLKAIQEENKAKKTRIMQRAYLDWRNFKRYFDFLLEEGFIKCTPDTCYKLTEKGEGLLTRLQEVDEIAGSKWRL